MGDVFNRLNEIPVAKIEDFERNEIKGLEKKLGNKYYLIAFERKDRQKYSQEL